MKLFGQKRIRRRHLRKFVWIIITALAAAAMVIATAIPAFNR